MDKLVTLFKIPELRLKILITAGFLVLYRVGSSIPLPIVNQDSVYSWAKGMSQSAAGKMFGYVAMLSGINDLNNITIFGLGIMPYISASIIFQLLASVVPTLEKLMKEGESGRKKINEYTRYATVLLAFGQSVMWVRYLMGTMNAVPPEYCDFWHSLLSAVVMTCGTILLMWIGEQIDEYGIGNGISLIIMAGIVIRMPRAAVELFGKFKPELEAGPGSYGVDTIIVLALLFVGVIVGVIAITQSQRRIPTQSAKHVRGRRVYGGTRQYLPLRVNQSGVMPIIFASSLLMFPQFLFNWLYQIWPATWFGAGLIFAIHDIFQRGSGFVYNLCYIGLIYFFCYLWTAITFNPKDMANNLKDMGSFIPGYRPGRRTAEYLEKVMLRITYVGAAFLAVVAITPTLVYNWLNVDYVIAAFFGGTGLLIAVSVALDLVQKIDSHLVMRNYSGLMERR
jgi:preprotein translocase subunit SecY